MNVCFLSLANQEVADAVEWYESKEEGLSRQLLDELDRVVRLIKRYPEAGTSLTDDVRRFPLTRFPYSIVYAIEADTLVVIAVAHQSRRPMYWAE